VRPSTECTPISATDAPVASTARLPSRSTPYLNRSGGRRRRWVGGSEGRGKGGKAGGREGEGGKEEEGKRGEGKVGRRAAIGLQAPISIHP